jgi:hypothetical protein
VSSGIQEPRLGTHGDTDSCQIMSLTRDLFAQTSLYCRLRDETVFVAEPDEPYRHSSSRLHPSEHLLHLLWQRQELLRQPLKTFDDRPLTVYRPGRWMRTHGPDFQDAKVRLADSAIRVGAVEVHVWASDWFRHGHDRDVAYTKVLLHVVWQNDLGARSAVDASGRQIPQIALSEFLMMGLPELQGLLEEENPPARTATPTTPCQRSLQGMPAEAIGQLLDMAGEERWRQKANRFALRAERRGVEQALSESLLEALGFQGNRLPFWQLARLAPVEQIRAAMNGTGTTPIQLQAILYGVSGFLQRWQAMWRTRPPGLDAYLTTLLTHWAPLAPYFPECLDEHQWRAAGIRPANAPQRRIAAASYLLAGLSQQTLMDRFLGPLRGLGGQASRLQLRSCQRELARRLRVTGEADFWGRRYAIDGAEHGRPIDLLGAGRASTMVVDILLPAAAALAQLGQEAIDLDVVRTLYRSYPRLPGNEVTRDVLRQFFGTDPDRRSIVDSACRQQGLIQL